MAEAWAPGQAQLPQNSDGFHVPGIGMSVDVAGMPREVPEGPAGGEGNTPARRISRVYNILLEQLPRSVQQRVASQLVVMTSSLCQSQSCSLETATMVVQQQLLPRMQQALRRLQQQQQAQERQQDRGQATTAAGATIPPATTAGREAMAHRQPQHPSHGNVPAFTQRLSMPQPSREGDGAGPPDSVRTPIINQAPGVQLLRTSDQRLSVPGGGGPDPAGMIPGSPHVAQHQPQQQHVAYYTGPSYATMGARGGTDHVPGMVPGAQVDQSSVGDPSAAMGYTAMLPPQTTMRPQQYGLAAGPMAPNHYPFPQQQGAQGSYGMAASLPVPMTAQQHNAIVAPPPPQQPHVFSMAANIPNAWGTHNNNGNGVAPHPMQQHGHPYYTQQGRAQVGPQTAWGRDPLTRPASRSQFPPAATIPVSPRAMEASTAALFGTSVSLNPPASTRVPSRGPSAVAWPGARTPSFDSSSFLQQQQFGGRLRSPNHSLEPPPAQQRIDHHGDTGTPAVGLALATSSAVHERSPVALGQHSPYTSYQPPPAFPQQQQVAMGPVQEEGVVPVRGMIPGLPLQRHEPLPSNHPATMEPTLCAGCGQLHVPTCTSWLCPPCCRAAALGPGPGLACTVHSVGGPPGGGGMLGQGTAGAGATRPPSTSFWPSLIGHRVAPSGALGPPPPGPVLPNAGPEAATQQMRGSQPRLPGRTSSPLIGAGYGQTGTAAAVVQQQQPFQHAGIPPAAYRTATPSALRAASPTAAPATVVPPASSTVPPAPVVTTHDPSSTMRQSPGLRVPPQQNRLTTSDQDRGGESLPPPRASLLLSGAAASTASRPPHKQAPHEGLVRYIARYWRRALAVPPAKRARRAAERVAEEVQELRHGALDRYMERIALLDELFDGEAADSGGLVAEEVRGQTFGQRALRDAAQRARKVESTDDDSMRRSTSNNTVEDYAVQVPLGIARKVGPPDPRELAMHASDAALAISL